MDPHRPNPDAPRRTRVAIVGGGLSGLTAAYELSRTEELRARFDVTVYQMGWRLGGKIASGRNPERSFRNEEHGLHVWFGFYHNAFRLLDELDATWVRPDDFPFSSLAEGFRPESYVPLGDADGKALGNDVGHTLRPWHVHFPRNCGRPGAGGPLLSGWEVLSHSFGWLGAVVRMAADANGPTTQPFPPRRPWSYTPRRRGIAAGTADMAARPFAWLIRLGARANPRLRVAVGGGLERIFALLMHLLRPGLDLLARRGVGSGHTRTIVETSLAYLRGVCHPRYGVLEDFDLDRLNHLDYRDFLVENGARREVVDGWAGLRALYDAMFQYLDGDPERPSFEAGTALRILLRAGLLYRGAAFWIPRAGLGELVVAPLYEHLLAQGVKVRLFHELVDAELSPSRLRVQRLRFRVQARARDGDYRPTFVHRGMVCWPAAPDWAQLEGGEAMARDAVDLEAPGSGPGAGEVVLEEGRDVDEVILALPLGTLTSRHGTPSPCREVVEASPRLTAFCRSAGLAPSLSVQLWSSTPFGAPHSGSTAAHALAGLGWSRPLSIWADMSDIIPLEGWNAGPRPQASYYLCGAWPAASTDPEEEQTAALEKVAGILGGPTGPWTGFDGRRLLSQVVRVNARPADLCDGAAVGTSLLRPEVHETGLANVTYCGTWTRTGINSTCVEAAVMSGMAAARRLTGEPRAIVGEGFLAAPTRPEAPIPDPHPSPAGSHPRPPSRPLTPS